MNKLFVHNAIFRIGAGPIFGVMVYLLILLINNTVKEINEIFNNQELYVCIVLSYINFESMRMVIVLIDNRLLKDGSIQTGIIYQIIITLLVSLTLVGLSISLYFRYIIGFSIGSSELNVFLLIFAAGGLLYNTMYFSQMYLFRENKIRIEEEHILRENLESEFLSFRHDINPNLLYESLESLILALHKNEDQADELIDNLAGIYRYSIINRNKELISLQEEAKAIHYLLSILDFKYPNQIIWDNQVTDEDISLIPGSVIVSIDNIVRNTLISSDSPLQLKLYLEDDYLVLHHMINERLIQHEDSLRSFEKLQRSYSFFSEKPFVQVKANRENYIKFPIVMVSTEQSIHQGV